MENTTLYFSVLWINSIKSISDMKSSIPIPTTTAPGPVEASYADRALNLIIYRAGFHNNLAISQPRGAPPCNVGLAHPSHTRDILTAPCPARPSNGKPIACTPRPYSPSSTVHITRRRLAVAISRPRTTCVIRQLLAKPPPSRAVR